MKSKDIIIGNVYRARVSGRIVRVRITGTQDRIRRTRAGDRFVTHYLATNLQTGRHLEIKSAQRIRPLDVRDEPAPKPQADKTVQLPPEVDNLLRDTVQQNFLRWSCGHLITCGHCGNILDCRSAVNIDISSRNSTYCGACADKLIGEAQALHPGVDVLKHVEVIDGRKMDWDFV